MIAQSQTAGKYFNELRAGKRKNHNLAIFQRQAITLIPGKYHVKISAIILQRKVALLMPFAPRDNRKMVVRVAYTPAQPFFGIFLEHCVVIIINRKKEMMSTIEPGIFCPACKMKNDAGAIKCIYCNTVLRTKTGQKSVRVQDPRELTALLQNTYEDFLNAPSPATEPFMDFEIPSRGIVLINLENGQMITTQKERSFILGRASNEVKPSEVLVDLTQLGALELGISRLHAMIRQTNGKYQLIDLNSSNGTWLENQRLVPKQPYPLESGDRIRLGRLNILVFYLQELNSVSQKS